MSYLFGSDGGISAAAVTEKAPHMFDIGLLRYRTPTQKYRDRTAWGKGGEEINNLQALAEMIIGTSRLIHGEKGKQDKAVMGKRKGPLPRFLR